MACDFTERMELGKLLAKESREHYGSSTVRVVEHTTAQNYRGCAEPDNFDIWLKEVEHRVNEAREHGLDLIYPDRLTIPF